MPQQQLLRLVWQRTELPRHVVTGREGEEAARRFLARKGYRILGVNARVGVHDEIDIIAFDPADKVIAFVEVKSRRREDPDFDPEMNLTSAKRASMSRAARRWIEDHGWAGGYRLDAILVTEGAVRRHLCELQLTAAPSGF